MSINKKYLLYFALLLSVILSLAGLTARLAAERSNKTVAFVVDYRDVASLAYQNSKGLDSIWNDIHKLGANGIAVPEYTGDELATYSSMPVKFGSAASVIPGESDIPAGQAVIKYPGNMPGADTMYEYIKTKLPEALLIAGEDEFYVVLPGNVDEFKYSTFVPDVQALDFCAKYGIPVLFRPGPCTPSSGRQTADALRFLFGKYSNIKNVIPNGLIAPGYPETQPVADVLKECGITLSQVEFVKQIGVPELASKVGSHVIPMHSLTRDEIISRNINRSSIYDRFMRAIHERSIRLLMLHPYDLQMGGRFDIFKEDLASYKEALEARGYTLGWPMPIPKWGAPIAGALACGLIFIFNLWFYGCRMTATEDEKIRPLHAAGLFVLAFAFGAAMWKVSIAAKLLGGVCGALAALEAALTALESSKCRVKGAIVSLVMVLAGGLAIASFYGTSAAALRLTPFSGVKLTLLLPPLLLLAHDLTRRVHPESVGEIVARPALWGELVIIGVMMLALLVMALRSDNVSNVPELEVAFRDFMERVMVVRPRTKEFLIGYPALVLYWYLVRNDYLPHYREAVRIAAVLAFCSAVNTFCHFHTLLYLGVIRDINGWWLGLLLGVICVAAIKYAALPIYRKISAVL